VVLSVAGTEPLVKKLTQLQIALIIGFVLHTGLASAQNLIANPGFETGDPSGWVAFGPPSITAETS